MGYMSKQALVDEFDSFHFEDAGICRTVYRLGEIGSPPILIMQELPGMTVHTLRLAKRLVDDGFVVYLPLLFGNIGSPIEPLKNAVRLCIQKEFNFIAWHKTSPITDWLRALCRHISAENVDQSIGAIGMCLTGRFVLSLMVEKALVAPVMSQPGHPKGHGNKVNASTLGIPATEQACAKARAEGDNISVLGLRFERDPFCPPERFETMEKEFGPHFMRFDIDGSLYAEHNIRDKAHAVLTIDYQDRPDHPTRLAYEKLVGFMRDRLAPKG